MPILRYTPKIRLLLCFLSILATFPTHATWAQQSTLSPTAKSDHHLAPLSKTKPKILPALTTPPKKAVPQQHRTFQAHSNTKTSVVEQLFQRSRETPPFSIRVGNIQDRSEFTVSPSNTTLPTLYPSDNTKPLSQFGHTLFKSSANTPFQLTDIPVSSDYILGPGDSLIIRIWGKLENALEVTIDANGNIYLPKIGHVPLSGARYGQLETILRKELEKIYVNFELSVTMGKIRSMKVFLLGEVKRPGAYDVSSLTTFFLALYGSGGPTKMGSLRNIQLKRGKKTIQTIDLYKYLLAGDQYQDPKLKAYDTIFVPPIGNVVAISGQVKRPAIFEIKHNTSAYDGITQLAGGFLPYSYGRRIQIERIQNGSKKTLLDHQFSSQSDMKKKLSKIKLRNGDHINIVPIENRLYNALTIAGQVKRPGNYAFQSGMTLKNLVDVAEGFETNVDKTRIEVYRYVSDQQRKLIAKNYLSEKEKQFPLHEWDIVKVYPKHIQQFVRVEGAIENPGKYAILKEMRLSDLAYIVSPKPYADLKKIELFRKNIHGKDEIINIDLTQVYQNPNHPHNLRLSDQDYLFIRFQTEDVAIKRITLSGEVRYPGTYIALENERLSSIIDRAGGYTPNAFLEGAHFYRKSIQEKEQRAQESILNEEHKRMIFDQQRLKSVDTHNNGSYKEALAFIRSQIDKNQGRMIIHLKTNRLFKDSKDDITIEDKDSLHVPSIPASVQIIGGVQMPASLPFAKGQPASYYIAQVGGYTDFADPHHTLILKANGTASNDTLTIQRGDTIYIPEKVKIDTNWLDIVVKTSQTLFNIATSIVVIKNL